MQTIVLPQLAGSREAANLLISRVGNVEGQSVVIDARDLISGSTSFADELVVRLVKDKRVAAIEVVGPDEEFWGYLTEAAADVDTEVRISQVPAGRLLV